MDIDPGALAALAQSGADALVGAMATDLWERIRTRIGRLLGGSPPEEQAALAELDDARAALRAAASEADSHETRVELRGLIRARLRANPAAAAEFAALVEEVAASLGAQQRTMVSFRARADRGSTITQSLGDVHYNDPR